MPSESQSQSDFITPPRAGETTCISVSAAAGSQDLSQCGPVPSSNFGLNNAPTVAVGASGPGCVGHFATFFADGADVYVIFGSTAAAVTAGNAPVAATNGVNAVGAAWKIPSGTEKSWKIRVQDRFVGFVASGAGQLRIARSSP